MGVTINDVAKAAKVSPSTVSRVIADNPRISIATRDRVLKIMKEMNYHPNFIARSLASKSTKIIGVIVPTNTEKAFQHPFFPEILRGIGSQAYKYKYNILISSVSGLEEEKEIVKEFARGGITEGIILLTSRVKDSAILELMKIEFPFVVVGRPENDQEVNWVDNNNYAAGYELTQYFIDKGHKRIAFVGVSPEFIVTLDRFQGYQKALEDNGIEFDESLSVECKFIDESDDGEPIRNLIDGKNTPTGIITCDDFLAFNAIKIITERGYKVPEDISVAGFNNVPLSNYSIPPLTSVDINAFGLGSKAFELLLDSISSEYKSFNRAIIPAQIIERSSVD